MLGILVAFALIAPQSAAPGTVTARLTTPEEYAARTADLGPADQGDWRVLSSPSRAPTAVDIANVLTEGTQRTVWVARAGADEDFPPGSYFLMRIRFDCEAHSAQPLWQAVYTAAGSNIFGQSIQQEPDRYSPASGGAEIAAVVCDGQVPAGQSFPTDEAFAASATPR